MSLKRIPSVGESLMSRIFALRSALFIARLSYALHVAARKTDGRRATAPTCPRDTQWTAIRQVTDERPTSAAAQPTNFLAPMPRGVLRGTQLASFEGDRKSTRLNSSHGYISYAVFCLKKKKK